MPGSSPPAPSHSSAGNPTGALQSYVNGGADTSNSTRIDGTAVLNFWEGNIIAYVPSAEAIEAVNIVTASFDAEQGQAGGSVVNLSIKSGTHNFHGAAWEYNTNSDLKARNFFYYGANNPENILNHFGLAMGGPIVRNKPFVFVDWERYMLLQRVSGLRSVPTDALRQGNFAGTGTTLYNPFTANPDGTGRSPFPNNQQRPLLLHQHARCLSGSDFAAIRGSQLVYRRRKPGHRYSGAGGPEHQSGQFPAAGERGDADLPAELQSPVRRWRRPATRDSAHRLESRE